MKNKNNLFKNIGGNMLIWILIIAMSISTLQFLSTESKVKDVTFTEFKDILTNKNIESAIIEGKVLIGDLISPIESSSSHNTVLYDKIKVIVPEVSLDLTELLDRHGTTYTFKETSFSSLSNSFDKFK